MSKYINESIGTFFLTLAVGLAVQSGSPLAPLAIGSTLMIMVYMGAHVSGAKYNPAVSLAVAMRGKMSYAEMAREWVAQLAGAILAAIALFVITGKALTIAPDPKASLIGSLLIEVLFTCALCLVVLNAATTKATEGNPWYGLAIGFTIFVAATAGGWISGGAFNPAVGLGHTLGSALFGGGSIANVWLYIVGPLAGGALAAVLYKLQHN